MGKKHRTFMFLLKRDLLWQLALIIAAITISLIICCMGEPSENINFGGMMIMMIGVFFTDGFSKSSGRYEEFQTFHFIRKKFYQYQVMLGFFRMMVVSVTYVIYQIMCREELIQFYMDGTDMLAENYNQNLTWLELLITNICIFMIIDQIQLIANTWIFGWFFIRKASSGVSLQNRLRIDEVKGNHPRIWKTVNVATNIIGFVLMVIAEMIIFGYYDVQLTKPLSLRMLVLAVLVLVWVILYLIGRKRYVPKYI